MSEGRFRDASERPGRTSVCRQCGALVGAGEENCSVCGATAAAARQGRPEGDTRLSHADRETRRFIRALVARPATFTIGFIVANVFLYLLMTMSGGAVGQVLSAYGAKRNDLINAGQWWRFVAPVFLHVDVPGLGPLHLLVNMYGLFMLGPFVEKLYGSARFVVFWVLAGVGGVVASYYSVRPGMGGSVLGRFLFKDVDAISAGASGALFGLIGVLFVFGIKFRHELPEGFKRAFGTGMLPIIVINLFIGFVFHQFIDNAAHLGGLLAGMTLALFVGYKRPGERGPVAFAWHAAQALALLLVAASFLLVALNFDAPPPRLSAIRERLSPAAAPPAAAYVGAVNAGKKAFIEALEGDAAAAAAPALERLEQVPPLSPAADGLRDELKSLLARARDLAAAQPRGREAAQAQERRLRQLLTDWQEWEVRFERWVNTEGGQFGLEMSKKPPPAEAAAEGARGPGGEKK